MRLQPETHTLRRQCRRQRAAATDDPRARVFNPSWSADGKTIRYGRSLVRADGSGHSELPRNVPLAGAWSPDGQRIAIVSVAHSSCCLAEPDQIRLGLWVMNADGKRRSAGGNRPGAIPARSPDGRRIAFRRSTANSDSDRPSPQTSMS